MEEMKEYLASIGQKEIMRKEKALKHLERFLALGGNPCRLRLMGHGDIVAVENALSGETKYVNVAGDSIGAMGYDIFRQAKLLIV